MSAVADPSKAAEPKLKIPPSAATSQYPPPAGPAAMPSMGSLRWMEPVDPWNERVAVAEDATVGGDEPVAGTGGRGRHADHRLVEVDGAGRARGTTASP